MLDCQQWYPCWMPTSKDHRMQCRLYSVLGDGLRDMRAELGCHLTQLFHSLGGYHASQAPEEIRNLGGTKSEKLFSEFECEHGRRLGWVGTFSRSFY